MKNRDIVEVQIIDRINKEFKDELEYPIPADQPIATHTQEEINDIGCLAWYFLPKFEKGATKEENLIDDCSSVIGSKHTMSKLLKQDKWALVPESEERQGKTDWKQIEIVK